MEIVSNTGELFKKVVREIFWNLNKRGLVGLAFLPAEKVEHDRQRGRWQRVPSTNNSGLLFLPSWLCKEFPDLEIL